MFSKKRANFFLFSFFLITLPMPNLNLEKILTDTKNLTAVVSSTANISGNFEIFKDDQYQMPTVNFNPGESVFVRIRTQSSGEKERSLKLLNEQKTELKSLELTRGGDSSNYIFTLSLVAPQDQGVYYFKVIIDSGQGTIFSGERNINIGKTGDVSVSSKSQNVVGGEKKELPQIEALQKERSWGIIEKIRDFLEKILSLLRF